MLLVLFGSIMCFIVGLRLLFSFLVAPLRFRALAATSWPRGIQGWTLVFLAQESQVSVIDSLLTHPSLPIANFAQFALVS